MSTIKNVKKGNAYNYYTLSERYSESNKYDAIAKKLYKTLIQPIDQLGLSAKELIQKKVELKRFSCRHTYPACKSTVVSSSILLFVLF
jgi:hypothetical protein